MLAGDLIEMAVDDDRVRTALAKSGELFQGYHPVMQEVHERNAARLEKIIDVIGWPTEDRVGKEASDAAWLVLQHAISKPALQRSGLELLRPLARTRQVDPIRVAMLEDRIRFFEGRSQLYGTQFDWDEHGEMSPVMMDDVASVNERRIALGLPIMDEAIKAQRASVMNTAERPPEDMEVRKSRFLSWCKEVGWR